MTVEDASDGGGAGWKRNPAGRICVRAGGATEIVAEDQPLRLEYSLCGGVSVSLCA